VDETLDVAELAVSPMDVLALDIEEVPEDDVPMIRSLTDVTVLRVLSILRLTILLGLTFSLSASTS